MQSNLSALLVMDVQKGIVQRFGAHPGALEPFQRAVAAARGARVPVIFIRVAFRDGYPEVSPRNKSFSTISSRGSMTVSDVSTQIHDSIAPLPGDAVVKKAQRRCRGGIYESSRR